MSRTRAALRRSSKNRMVAGVLGGIAEYFDLNARTLRIIYVVVSILSAGFPGTIVYIVLALLIPRDDRFRPA